MAAAAYPNRSDIRQDVTKQAQYGQGVANAAAARALPPGPAPSENVPTLPEPGARGPLTRPTERPGEPVTAGLPVGPGAGPGVLSAFPAAPPAPGSPQAILESLRALLATVPDARNANLVALIGEVEKRASSGR